MRKPYYLLLGVKFCLVRRGVSVTDGGQRGGAGGGLGCDVIVDA